MRARRVLHVGSSRVGLVGQTIVAHWWPGKYYFVSTIQIDSSSASSRLTRSLKTGVDYMDVKPEPDVFVTNIFKCDKNGRVKPGDSPLYEQEYSDLNQAKLGHKEIVDLLAEGRLKLQRIS